MSETTTGKIIEIEYLRAIAILITLFAHAPKLIILQPNPTMGWILEHFSFTSGVDLFFAISGFVIMRSFTHQMATQGKDKGYFYNAKVFWTRRVFRIFPAAWFWLFAMLFLTIFVNYTGSFGNMEQNIKDALAGFFQYANFNTLSCMDFETQIITCGPSGLYWSLSLEEQFYILLPMAIFFFRKHLPGVLFVFAIAQFFIPRPAWSTFWSTRTDAIIWGVLLAIWSSTNSYKERAPVLLEKYSFLKYPLLFLSLWSLFFLSREPHKIDLATGIIAIVAAFLVWVASYDRGFLFSKSDGPVAKIFMWLGSRSYSLYLTHVLAYRLAWEISYQLSPVGYRNTGEDSPFLSMLAIIVSVIWAELSYRYIEMPFRKMGLRIAGRM